MKSTPTNTPAYEPKEDKPLKNFLSKKESNRSMVFKDYTPTRELIRKSNSEFRKAFGIKTEAESTLE